MKVSKILVLAEKNYQKSVWCSKILDGIGKKNFNLVSFEDLYALNENDVVVIVGSTSHFLRKSILLCIEKKLRCIVVGAEISDFDSDISSIKVSRKSAVTALVHYFNHQKRVNCALLGVNSFSNIDMEKKDAFLSANKALYNKNATKNVFLSDEGVKNCVDNLLDNISKFDSVICFCIGIRKFFHWRKNNTFFNNGCAKIF